MVRMGSIMTKETKIIHSGLEPKKIHGSLTTPIYKNSTLAFNNYKDFLHAKKNKYTVPYYGRFGTYTTKTLEKIVCQLYSSEKSIITSSGLSAITSTIFSLVKKNENILIVENCYEPVANYINLELKKCGVNPIFYKPTNESILEKKINNKCKLIYLESPSSLNYEMQDIEKIVKIAKKRNIITIMDNTWSTFLGINPLNLGIDIVIESATKYLSGHSDCFCGIIACSEKIYKKIKPTIIRIGDFVSSENCYLTIRGLKTLSLRMEKHNKNAYKVYKYLQSLKEISYIFYPPGDKGRNFRLWKKYHKIGNSLITFSLNKNNKSKIESFVDNLKIFKIGFSYGGFESLILPLENTFFYKKNSKAFWFRIHLGLENHDDLIKDIKYALKKYNRS